MTRNYRTTNVNAEQLARGLGWFSIWLGLTEVLEPRGLSRLIGVRPRPLLMRLFGLREIASGVGILMERQPIAGIQARVAGDMLDLASLGLAFSSEESNSGRLAAATLAVAGVTALDLYCHQALTSGSGRSATSVPVEHSITINRSPAELYRYWHNFEGLPRFMNHLKSVQMTGENRSHWVAKGPAGATVEWDAETTDDQPDRRIAWCSLPGADVNNSGEVQFERAPGGRGTVVRVKLEDRPPGGVLGGKIALLLGEAPEKQLVVDLHRFKQMVETGEIATTEGQPAGRARSTSMIYDDFVRK